MIDVRIDVDDRRLVARFNELPPRVQRDLVPAIQRWAGRALAIVESQEPSRTGRLRAETQAFVDQGADYVRGRVRVLNENGKHNIRAAALEYGSHRAISVSAHNMNLGHFWDRPGVADVSVPSYQRRTNITAVRYLRQAMQATSGTARAEIETAINQSLRDAL